jgi:CRISPR-associated protein Cas1
MQILNSLYVTTQGSRVSAKSSALEVRANGALLGRFPLHGLDHVFAFGQVDFSSDALARSAENNTRVALLSGGGKLRFTVGGPTSGNVLLRTAQHRAADNESAALALAKMFVAAKLQGQRRLIQRWAWDAEPRVRRHHENQVEVIEQRLTRVASATDGDQLRGLEGDAARRYFKSLGAHLDQRGSDFAFVTRSRRPPTDPVNCVLSFIYGVLTGEIVAALDAVGLDPQIGFLHQPRPGRPSLALDLLEEFRAPLVDRLAVSLLARRQLRLEHFTTVAGSGWYLSDEGRRVVFAALNVARTRALHHAVLDREIPRALLPTVQATLLARHLRGDLMAYPPYVAM